MSRRSIPILSFVAAPAVFVLLVAGCGGGSGSPGVASVASSTNTATSQPGLVGYARCMRSNGVPSFPDPGGKGEIPKAQVVAAAQRNRGKFDSASTACNHLLPSTGLATQDTVQQKRIQLADELSFARCMRSHGVSAFPDPTAQAGLSVEMVQAHGIDVHSPQVLRVIQKCLPASHGGLTAAKVRRAIAEAPPR